MESTYIMMGQDMLVNGKKINNKVMEKSLGQMEASIWETMWMGKRKEKVVSFGLMVASMKGTLLQI